MSDNDPEQMLYETLDYRRILEENENLLIMNSELQLENTILKEGSRFGREKSQNSQAAQEPLRATTQQSGGSEGSNVTTMDLTSVNYVPVLVQQLPEMQDIQLTGSKFLVATPDESLGYATAKLPYDNLFNRICADAYTAVTQSLSALSVYPEISDLQLPDSDLNRLFAFGAVPIKYIYRMVHNLSSYSVNITGDQFNISGDKMFFEKVYLSSETSSITSDSQVPTVGWVNERVAGYTGNFVFSNDTAISKRTQFGDPSTGSSNQKKLGTKGSYYVYTVESDCLLYVSVMSKQTASGMTIRFGNSDKSTADGYLVSKLPDNDTEAWWTHSMNFPVKAGTYVKFCPAQETPLWWLLNITEYTSN